MPKIDVCLSPEMIHLYPVKDHIVVVTDIFRATSCMVTAFAHGVKDITPVATLDECHALREKGCIGAAERNGEIVEGFELGNSPYSYMDEQLKGQSIAVTTTNGTIAITKSFEAREVLIGAFLNLSAITAYLKSQGQDVLVVCAGWKGKFSLEDTLFAGALVDTLSSTFDKACDAPKAAYDLYKGAQGDLWDYLRHSAHANRLRRLSLEKDMKFCLTKDVYDVIPKLNAEKKLEAL